MNIIKPTYEIISIHNGMDAIKLVEKVGRTCYMSNDKITEDGESAVRFNKMLIGNGHEAMLEHSMITVMFTVDRGVTHEFVRHRTASFAQESTRYVNYSKGKFGNQIGVIDIAGGIDLDGKMSKMSAEEKLDVMNLWYEAIESAEKYYMKMIELGATPQIARSVLPQSTKATLTITANFREWRHILKLRTAPDAHPQIREVCIPLLAELKKRVPVIFDDIE